jgi:hypothetical protein
MPRKLKTYLTSAGFHDLAIAAPSMKAALEAWGSRANLFQQGFARQTHDAAIVDATMAKPGVVLRRPVGSHAAFREDAGLPRMPPTRKPKPPKRAKARKAPRVDDKAERQAAVTFERERRRREAQRLKEEQAEIRAEARRERAIRSAEAALEKARAQHEQRARAEDSRWGRQRAALEAALRKAKRP